MNAAQRLLLLGEQTTLQGFFLALGAVLLYDGTPTNLGTAGSTFNGTPTDVTTDSTNGMNFNGTTSSVEIPNGAAWADLINSGAYTIVAIARATTVGENNSGRIWTVGASNHLCATSTTPNLQAFVARASVPALTTLTTVSAYPSSRFIMFMGWSGSAITGHGARAGDTALTAGSDSNGSGAVTSVGSSSLFLGNRSNSDRTWDGSIRLWALIPKVMSTDERNVAFGLAQPLLNAA